jgi:alpha-tubulin suppressor-like RCC1 family protein
MDGELGDGDFVLDDCFTLPCSQSPVPLDVSPIVGSTTFVSLSTGEGYTICGVTADGVAYCWGRDLYGELGDGDLPLDLCAITEPCSHVPALVDTSAIAGETTFTQIDVGFAHTCGLTGQGVPYCWGRDDDGELGNGGASLDTDAPSPVDTAPLGGKVFKRLVAATYHTCGLTADGDVYCWGDDSAGQVGDGGVSTDSQVPAPIDLTPVTGEKAFIELEANALHVCGITGEGVSYCWGRDADGQLGDGPGSPDDCAGTPCSQSPLLVDTAPVTSEKSYVQLTAGSSYACGLTGDGEAYCWGANYYGALGDGGVVPQTQSAVAVDVSTITGETSFYQLAAGSYHTCGLTAEGVAYCWGSDEYGQLGDGVAPNDDCDGNPCMLSPVAVDTSGMVGDTAFVKLEAGSGHTCGLTAEGVAYCWGRDTWGQLGDGLFDSSTHSPVPVDVSPIGGDKSFVLVTAGYSHSCGITVEGLVYCWGDDWRGQLGSGGASTSTWTAVALDTTPITGETAIKHLTAGYSVTCGLTADGVPYCWGSDAVGQLGNGSAPIDDCSGTPCSQSPEAVDTSPILGEKSFTQVAIYQIQGCGITADRIAYCWGRDNFGQLGDGGVSVDSVSPVAVDIVSITGDTTFFRLECGSAYTCGLTSERVAYCWGVDSQGRLGDGNLPKDTCGASPCSQSPSPVGGCDDGVYCNGLDDCDGLGGCTVNLGDPCPAGPECDNAACDEVLDNCYVTAGTPCTETTPNDCYMPGCSGTGTCVQTYATKASGEACDDGEYCTGTDTCDAVGGCTNHTGDPCSGGPECNQICNEVLDNCLDPAGTPCGSSVENQCNHADTCDGASLCLTNLEADGTGCDDLDPCSDLDTCQTGVCQAGMANKDTDLDTYVDQACGGSDCDDSLAFVNPGASEGPAGDPTCTDTHDNDCSGQADMNDPVCVDCQFDTDCDDGNICTTDSCSSGVCSNIAVPDGRTCDDGVYCTEPDTCQAGFCTGPPRDCSTVADDCNIGICIESPPNCAAQPANEGGGCDDGQYCTVTDVCAAGNCSGTSRVCDDSDPCTTDFCDEAGDACDSTLTPIPGAEGPRGDASCSDGIDNDCDLQTDGNDPDCVLCGSDTQCNDGNPCTTNTCVSQQCQTSNLPNGTNCDDGLHCTAGDSCQSGVCTAGAQLDCSGLDNECNIGICNETTDSCEQDPVPRNGDSCNDGDLCTQNDTCQNGGCVSGSQMDCSGADEECVSGGCVAGRCEGQSMGEGVVCAGCYRCRTSEAGTLCDWSSNLTAGPCQAGECQIPMARCDGDNNCVIEGYCDQPVEGCGIPVVYGKGPGETLNCRMLEGKVGVQVKMEPASAGVGSFIPVRLYLTNTPISRWNKCIYNLKVVLEFNPEGEGEPGGSIAYVLQSALLQGGEVRVEEAVDESQRVILTLGGEEDCLPAPKDGGLWVLDFLLLRSSFEEGWFRANVLAPCDSKNDVMGCHDTAEQPYQHRVSGTWFIYSNGKSFEEGESVGQMLQSHALGCQCGKEGGGWLLGILMLLVLRMRFNYLKRATRDVTHRFEE